MSTPRILSLAALTVLDLSPVDMVRAAAQAGFTHVGLRPIPSTDREPDWRWLGNSPMRREVLAAMADLNVKVLDVEILRLKPDTDPKHFGPILDAGAALGARHVLVAGNDPDEARLSAHLAALADQAQALGLMPCLEPMPWTDVKDFRQALRVVEATGSAHVGVLVDPIHFDRASDVPAMLEGVPASRLPYMQFCDAVRERPTTLEALLHQARAERQLPGHGGLKLPEIVRALPAGIPLSIELPLAGVHEGLSPFDKAKLVAEATRAWLAQHDDTPAAA